MLVFVAKKTRPSVGKKEAPTWEKIANKINAFYIVWYERAELRESNIGYGYSEADRQKLQTTHSLQEIKKRSIEIVNDAHICVEAAPDEPPEQYIGKTPKQIALDTRVKWADEHIAKCATIPSDNQSVRHEAESECTYAVEQVRYGLHTSGPYRESIIKGCPVLGIDEQRADRYIQTITDELDFAHSLSTLKDQIEWNKSRFEEEKTRYEKLKKKK